MMSRHSLERRLRALSRHRIPKHPVEDLPPYPGFLVELMLHDDLMAGDVATVNTLIALGRERCAYDGKYDHLVRRHGRPLIDVRNRDYREKFGTYEGFLRRLKAIASPHTPRPGDVDHRSYRAACRQIGKVAPQWRRKIWEQMFYDWVFPGDPPVYRSAPARTAPGPGATAAAPQQVMPGDGKDELAVQPQRRGSSGVPSSLPPAFASPPADDAAPAGGLCGPAEMAADADDVEDDDPPPRPPIHPLIDENGRRIGPYPSRFYERRQVVGLLQAFDAETRAWQQRQHAKQRVADAAREQPESA